jgi:hypothetical protein
MPDPAKMAADIRARKVSVLQADTSAPVAPSLTPVGLERTPGPLAGVTGPFPFDNPDMLRAALVTARREAEFILKGIDALIAAFDSGEPLTPTTAADIEADRRLADSTGVGATARQRAAADAARARVAVVPVEPVIADEEPFPSRFERLSADAQSQAFAGNYVPAAQEVFAGMLAEWVCPTHGNSTINNRVSRRGRKYRACTTCGQFEKETP